MRIYVRVKVPGRRKDVLQPTPYDIPDTVRSLRELLCALAEAEVSAYNAKEPEKQLVDYLTAEQIEAQAEAGKVSFGVGSAPCVKLCGKRSVLNGKYLNRKQRI